MPIIPLRLSGNQSVTRTTVGTGTIRGFRMNRADLTKEVRFACHGQCGSEIKKAKHVNETDLERTEKNDTETDYTPVVKYILYMVET